MNRRFDEIDRRIIYHLSKDARNTSAPDMAKEVDVSPGTIRNRIKRLEEDGIIRGYHADVDYEKIGGRLVNLFECSSEVQNRGKLARRALGIRGVVNVREVMTGEGDLHIKAVGEDTEDLTRIARELVRLGVEIEDEDLIEKEHFHPYHQFGPQEEEMKPIVDFREFTGNAQTVDLTIHKNVPVAGKTVKRIGELGMLDQDTLLVAIEREDKIITPRGNTRIEPGDIVSIFSPSGINEDVLESFTGAERSNSGQGERKAT